MKRRMLLTKPIDRFLHYLVLIFGLALGLLWAWPRGTVTDFAIAIGSAAVLALYVWLAYRFGAVQALCRCSGCGAMNLEEARRCRKCSARMTWLAIDEQKPPQPGAIPALARAQAIAWTVSAVAIVAMFVGQRLLPLVWIVSAIPVLCCLLLAVSTWRSLRVRAAQRSVMDSNAEICPSCLYPLAAHMAQCPECGRPGTPIDAREQWHQANLWFPDEVAHAAHRVPTRSSSPSQSTPSPHQTPDAPSA